MEALPISSRVSGLQVPLSRIQSLARAVLQMIDEMEEPEGEAHRQVATDITNFADLILDLASQASKEAETIERDVTKQERAS